MSIKIPWKIWEKTDQTHSDIAGEKLMLLFEKEGIPTDFNFLILLRDEIIRISKRKIYTFPAGRNVLLIAIGAYIGLYIDYLDSWKAPFGVKFEMVTLLFIVLFDVVLIAEIFFKDTIIDLFIQKQKYKRLLRALDSAIKKAKP